MYLVYPFLLWWRWEKVYFIWISSSNRKYDPPCHCIGLRPWNNDMCCMSFYIPILFACFNMNCQSNQHPFHQWFINSSPPGQNGSNFADNMFQRMHENIWSSNKISLKYVPWGVISNMSALVQMMAWRQIGYKPLSEPMLTRFTDIYMQHELTTHIAS